jgi:rubrerythrin
MTALGTPPGASIHAVEAGGWPGFHRPSNRREGAMASLKGSKTEDNLKEAFAGESQANRRYLYFAQKADVEGYNDVAAVFRSTAEGETGHAHGHLEFLEVSGDPATGMPMGKTSDNLAAAVAGETHEYTDMYPGMARTAREEGFDEIADWFETLAKAERSHAGRFQRALNELV